MSNIEQNLDLEIQRSQFMIDMLRQGYSVKLRVIGQSMYPSILSGSEVTICPIEQEDIRFIKKGELILCLVEVNQATSPWVLHRVLRNKCQSRQLIMGGDRLLVNDEARNYEQVLGRVTKLDLPDFLKHQPRWRVHFLSALTQTRPESYLTRYLGLSYLHLYRIYKHIQSAFGRLMKAVR